MQDNKNTADIIIIGAGLTGLSMAHKLKKKGKKILLIDKKSVPGGVMQTQKEDSFIFETGANTGTLSTHEVVELLCELKSECKLETANKKSQKRLILKKDKLHALPAGVFSAVSTPLFSFKDKIRLLSEPFRPKGNNPNESLADMVRRRMGKSFLEYAVDPFIGGIYAGDPEKIIPKYALPKLYELEQEYGSFIKGAVKKSKQIRKTNNQGVTKEVFTVEGGFTMLIKALSKSVGIENVHLNAKNTKIIPENNLYKAEFTDDKSNIVKLYAPKIISTVGAYQLNKLFTFLTAEELAPVQALRYAKIVLAVVGYNKWVGRELDAFGCLIPSKENCKLLGVLFPSAIFKNRAPKEGALLSAFIGGIRHPEVFDFSNAEIKKTFKNFAARCLNAPNEPDLFKIFRYKHAIPQYEISSQERLAAIKHIETKYKGLILAGNIRDGIGVADRVKQAFQIAENILD